MSKLASLLIVLGLSLLGSGIARAECGGSVDCIGISSSPTVPPEHSVSGVDNFPAPTLDYGSQTSGILSASRTILVAGVEGPVGQRATLNSITLSGPNAVDFKITGGTCTTGTPTLLHDGALVAQISNACTILVAFNPLTAGAKSAQLNVASSAITRIAPFIGVGVAPAGGAPTAGPVNLAVPSNSFAIQNLAPFTSGGATSVGVAVLPAHGTVTSSGTSITYTPTANYFGPDTLSYVAINASGASAPAVVTINVGGRPDPSQDAVVRGLLRAQSETAKRFARTQISNIQRRMESLHLGSSSSGASAGLDTGRGEITNNTFAAGRDPFAAAMTMPRPGIGLTDPRGVGNYPVPGLQTGSNGTTGERRENLIGVPSALLPASFVTTLAGVANTGSLNLSGTGRADGLAPQGTGLWLGGSVNFGTRDNTVESNALRFTTDGITIGIDHRFSDVFAAGASVGYARDKTRIGADGSDSRAHGTSVAFYGSYSPSRNVFVDGLLGFGVLDYDTTRYVAPIADFARGNRKGNQWFGSIAAGYEHRDEGLLLSPYARLDFATDRLKQASESGAGPYALTYHDQRLRSLNASLGLRAETAHQTSFGWAVPRLRVEFKHAFESDRTATIGYADQPGGPLYSVTGLNSNRNSVLLGFGSDFILRDGLKLGFDYQTLRSFGPDHSHTIRVWVSKELDGKGMPTGLVASKLFDDPLRVEAGISWDNNLNRAKDASEKISDRIYSINISKGLLLPITDHARVVVSGILSGDKLYTYTGLDRFSGGLNGEFQYRSSGEFDALTLGIFGRATIDEYATSLRSGQRYTVGVNARQALTDRIDIFGALSRNFHEARSDVFDGRDWSARVNLDYALGRIGSLYAGGEYRRGDTVTSASSSSLSYGSLAKASAPDDAYGSAMPLTAYRYEARTKIFTLGYNYPLGPRDSIDLSWRHARSSPTSAGNPLYGSTSNYTANLYSLAYLMRF